MSTQIVTQTQPTPTNGTTSLPAARAIPLAGAKVDRLLELRASLKVLQEQERALTAELVRTLQAQGLRALQGSRAVAILDERSTVRVDPELFHEAGGPAALQTMSVSVMTARKLMGAEDLAAISETTSSPVLRVEAIAPQTAAA